MLIRCRVWRVFIFFFGNIIFNQSAWKICIFILKCYKELQIVCGTLKKSLNVFSNYCKALFQFHLFQNYSSKLLDANLTVILILALLQNSVEANYSKSFLFIL